VRGGTPGQQIGDRGGGGYSEVLGDKGPEQVRDGGGGILRLGGVKMCQL
jgi:hypothetical protein